MMLRVKGEILATRLRARSMAALDAT